LKKLSETKIENRITYKFQDATIEIDKDILYEIEQLDDLKGNISILKLRIPTEKEV
jgi:hypothetical protein